MRFAALTTSYVYWHSAVRRHHVLTCLISSEADYAWGLFNPRRNASRPAPGVDKVRVPGDSSLAHRRRAREARGAGAAAMIHVDDSIYASIRELLKEGCGEFSVKNCRVPV